jgi:hypothetical protein
MRRRESTYPPVCPPANHQSSPSFGNDSPVGFTKARRDLANHHRRFLSNRAIDQEVARERGYWSIKTEASARGLGYRGQNARLGLAIPIHTVWGPEWAGRWTQLRPDDPISDEKGKVRKYLRPAKSETVVDVHPRSLDLLRNRSVPVVVTEGIPKADALTSLGFVTLGLLGVDCWSGNDGTVLPDLKSVALKERQAIIAFDSDARTNMHVLAAARRLGEELKRRGADVYLALPPAPVEGKHGWDDYLATLDSTDRTQQVLLNLAEPIDLAVPKLRPRLDVVAATDVVPETVEYLWPPYVPLGKLTIIDGDAGLGKTYLLLRLAAAMSREESLPGGTDGESVAVMPGRTLYLSLEDGVADTLVPRYTGLGGNRNALILSTGSIDVGGTERAFTFRNLDVLDAALAEHGPRLLVFDPLLGFLGADVDSNKSNETRPLLAQLGRLAERHRCAMVGIRHTRKSREGRAIHAGLGAVDISAAARSVLIVGKHPRQADAVVLAHTKSSTTRAGASIEFAIDEDGKLSWGGVSSLAADDLVAAPRPRGPRPAKRGAATEWLRDFLREAGDGGIAAGDLYEHAATEGHRESTVKRALRELGAEKVGRARAVMWRLRRHKF